MNTPHYPHPIIAREGWPFLAGSILIALLVTFLSPAWSILFWVIAVFVLQFFRDPARSGSTAANAVLSPADGRIVVVEQTLDPYGQREALKISVFMNVFNVHSNRSPVDGEVLSTEPIAIMVRKDDPEFKAAVNAAIAKIVANGNMPKLWNKWFLSPIPPKNIVVGLELSPQTKNAWANLNDKPAEDYNKK